MAAFDPIKYLCLKKILTLHSVKVSYSSNASFKDVLQNRCS